MRTILDELRHPAGYSDDTEDVQCSGKRHQAKPIRVFPRNTARLRADFRQEFSDALISTQLKSHGGRGNRAATIRQLNCRGLDGMTTLVPWARSSRSLGHGLAMKWPALNQTEGMQ